MKVTFTGVTPTYDEVAGYFKESSLFVLPSTVEGESIAAKEAMAAGLPVIAIKIRGSGVLSLVQDGKNGYLVEPSNQISLVQKIVELLKDQRKMKSMGEAGRKFVEPFDWKKVADRVLEAYGEVVG
jgi:glycosyltransferase involved in cell wall biosynthesis